ncbi:MAG: threonine-phosphate decarboxylase, partial [Pseudomonadota bacterium]
AEQNPLPHTPADHGGDLARAMARYGGARDAWLDLSTGINPVPYPLPDLPGHLWTALPDADLLGRAEAAARACWDVPDGLEVVFAGGASALIAALPGVLPAGTVEVVTPTYNEHARAFAHHGWDVRAVGETTGTAEVCVVVTPNNPDGRQPVARARALAIVDESFADVRAGASGGYGPGRIVLKSFGKFWGLAGLRLGAAIAPPDLAEALRMRLGPWAASGPALHIAASALMDKAWIAATRARIAEDAARLDALMRHPGVERVGGAGLFTTYDVADAEALHTRLAERRIWTRVFPYSDRWIRLGLPGTEADWSRLREALA